MKDQSNCIQLSKVLYRAYWHECLDISSTDVLLGLAKRIGAIPSDAKWDSLITSREKELLENATKECVNRGGPGVPVFFIQDLQTGESKLYWGQDRLLFVERDLHRLLRNGQQLPRSLYDRWLNPGPSRYTKPPALTLDFYFDIASPWSYLGWTQLQTVVRQSGVNVHIELVPILVGALFNRFVLTELVLIDCNAKVSEQRVCQWKRSPTLGKSTIFKIFTIGRNGGVKWVTG